MKSNGLYTRVVILLLLASALIAGWSATAQDTAYAPITTENAAQVVELRHLGRRVRCADRADSPNAGPRNGSTFTGLRAG
jgi:hypothetical protein